MFDKKQISALDPNYFKIILKDDRDVTIQSKCTGHVWYIHCCEYPNPASCVVFHKEWYRALLKEEVEKYLPKWEKKTGLYASGWQSKYMTTKWGTCNTNTKKIWLNLQLAKKPIECLEYVILHELAHLKARNHGAEFVAILDEHMPSWRDIRKKLNDSKLDYMPSSASVGND